MMQICLQGNSENLIYLRNDQLNPPHRAHVIPELGVTATLFASRIRALLSCFRRYFSASILIAFRQRCLPGGYLLLTPPITQIFVSPTSSAQLRKKGRIVSFGSKAIGETRSKCFYGLVGKLRSTGKESLISSSTQVPWVLADTGKVSFAGVMPGEIVNEFGLKNWW